MTAFNAFSGLYDDFEISCAAKFVSAVAERHGLSQKEKACLNEMGEAIRALSTALPQREYKLVFGCDELGGDPWYFLVHLSPRKFEIAAKTDDYAPVRLVYGIDEPFAANYFDSFEFLSASEDDRAMMVADCHYGALENNAYFFHEVINAPRYSMGLEVDGEKLLTADFSIIDIPVLSEG